MPWWAKRAVSDSANTQRGENAMARALDNARMILRISSICSVFPVPMGDRSMHTSWLTRSRGRHHCSAYVTRTMPSAPTTRATCSSALFSRVKTQPGTPLLARRLSRGRPNRAPVARASIEFHVRSRYAPLVSDGPRLAHHASNNAYGAPSFLTAQHTETKTLRGTVPRALGMHDR